MIHKRNNIRALVQGRMQALPRAEGLRIVESQSAWGARNDRSTEWWCTRPLVLTREKTARY